MNLPVTGIGVVHAGHPHPPARLRRDGVDLRHSVAPASGRRRRIRRTLKAWWDAFEGTWGAGLGNDQVWWRLPGTSSTEFMSGINLNFQGVGQGARLVSLTVQTWPFSGMTGTVVIDIGALRTEHPRISVAAEQDIIDIAFVHGGGFKDTRIFWRPGMIDFVWKRGAMRRGLTAPGG